MVLLPGPVLRIRIRKFLGLLDPDPSINKQNKYEKPNFLLFCDLLSLKFDVDVLIVSNKQKN
jgi:hypothetical protein